MRLHSTILKPRLKQSYFISHTTDKDSSVSVEKVYKSNSWPRDPRYRLRPNDPPML